MNVLLLVITDCFYSNKRLSVRKASQANALSMQTLVQCMHVLHNTSMWILAMLFTTVALTVYLMTDKTAILLFIATNRPQVNGLTLIIHRTVVALYGLAE